MQTSIKPIGILINLDEQRNKIHQEHSKAVDNLIRVGELLQEVRDSLEDISFKAFIETLQFSRTAAYDYMRLAEHARLYGSPTVGHALVSVSVWYVVPPDKSEVVAMIEHKVKNGEKVTRSDALTLLNANPTDNPKLNRAIKEASEVAPQMVAESLVHGVVLNLDGDYIPLNEADETLIHINSNEYEYERIQRQKTHIQENAKKQAKLECELELITDKDGVVWMALPQNTSLKLIKQTITIYYNELETETAREAA